ncbi:NAD(P)H-quinone oxidoreductase [Pseudidiomarina sp. 1APR75-33.1]|uniref:NAD(P)H-quinone oxidoreductase n=1 Tax=Pseudidiomarina terrestris TaxID=2820060 RepID=UPI00265720CC|nr:NAD(P)H-quinone oxidoreductase [Pseudidiomarina sp. 1APR75-33.1]MDN7126643.1 NAD(P)H-quinone oxidoreductase [Pseudidiomarina sp. 1APR75-33.1]
MPRVATGFIAEGGRPRQTEFELTTPVTDEVVIEISHSGVNRADLMQLAGHYPPPAGASDILGLEASGRVVAVGPSVSRLKVGDEVCALLAAGGYASHVVVSEQQVNKLPKNISLEQGAAICEAFTTAWYNLYEIAALRANEKLLLHAGASTVGLAALQLAVASGNPVFVTAGSDEKIDLCRNLGAGGGWNRQQGSFVEAVKAWGGADVIIDPVAGDYLAADQQVLNLDGRIVVLGLMGGRMAELDAGRLLMKRQRIQGSTLRNQSLTVKGRLMRALEQQVWPLLTSGTCQARIEKVYAIAELDTALQQISENKTKGKLVLAW